MAKKQQQQPENQPHVQTPFENLPGVPKREPRTLVIVDHQEKEVQVVSSINDKKPDNPFTYVKPTQENKPSFLKWDNSNFIAKFMQNFIAAARTDAQARGVPEDQQNSRYSFYEVPRNEVPNFQTAVQKQFEGDKSPEVKEFIDELRVYARELEKRKIERHELPMDAIKEAGVTIGKNDMEVVFQGGQLPSLYHVVIPVGDGLGVDSVMGLETYKTENGEYAARFISPLTVPEYLDKKYENKFSADDIALFEKGMQPERLFEMPNRLSGENEWCVVGYCKELGRLVPAPAMDIPTPRFLLGQRLEDDQMKEYKQGRRIKLENCKTFEGKSYACTVQYDALSRSPKTTNGRYHEINLPPSILKQCTPEQEKALREYKDLDGSQFKNKEGKPYDCRLWVDRNTNGISFGDKHKKARQDSRYFYFHPEEKKQQQVQNQDQGVQTPSRGRGM